MLTIVLAIAVTAGVFIGLSVVLIIAERFLVNYGDCVISVNDGEQRIEVQGGGTLLTELQSAGIPVPSACAGKGSCGYCRVTVLAGGGQVLPTEIPYLTRTEVRGNVRLACQVKVKNDIQVRVPDLLETVRTMVANKTFDTSMRWQWITTPGEIAPAEAPAEADPPPHLSHHEKTLVMKAIERHRNQRGSIVPLLQDINAELNFLPGPALELVAHELQVSVSHIFRVATFYNSFSLKPRGRNVIKVCMGTACYVKNGQKILDHVGEQLGIGVGECTADRRFSIETVSCIGCCGQSPSMSINEDIYGYLKPDMIDGILKQYT